MEYFGQFSNHQFARFLAYSLATTERAIEGYYLGQ